MCETSARAADASTRPETFRASGPDRLSQVATRNLAVAMSLRATAWRLAESSLRTFRPELSETEVQAEVRTLFRCATG